MLRIAFVSAGVFSICASALIAQTPTAALTLPIAPSCPPCPPPEPCTVWNFLGLSHHNIKKCRCCFCNSRLGRMCDSVATPFRLASGGLVPKICCDVPTREDLACMNADNCSLAELVAAKIKRDEAEACSRKAAVRFLGTVDCHYYHEAEEALIAHLRADQNECVRLEAAQVLAKGCCCTPRTIAALRTVVSGSAEDGNPPERSERVRSAAVQALHACLSSYDDIMPDSLQMPPLEVLPPPTLKLPIQLMSYTEASPAKKQPADLVLEAQRAYAAHVGAPAEERSLGRPSRNLLQIVSQATATGAEIELPTEREPPAREKTPAPRREQRDGHSLMPIGLTPIGAAPIAID